MVLILITSLLPCCPPSVLPTCCLILSWVAPHALLVRDMCAEKEEEKAMLLSEQKEAVIGKEKTEQYHVKYKHLFICCIFL